MTPSEQIRRKFGVTDTNKHQTLHPGSIRLDHHMCSMAPVAGSRLLSSLMIHA